jgi:outer membrane murein-binding lipoprotein Lpp
MSFPWLASWQNMMESIQEKYAKLVLPVFKRSREADKELIESHAIASKTIRSFIEEETSESLRKKTVLNMEADMAKALKKNIEIHSEAYNSLGESCEMMVDEIGNERETNKILSKKIAESSEMVESLNKAVIELNKEVMKTAQEKEAFKKEASRLKEENIKNATKLLQAEEEIRAVKKSNQLYAEAKERDIAVLCQKMDRYQEQIAALGLICEKLQKAIPQDSSAIILTAMTKNEFDLKTAKPLIKAASKMEWMAGLDQTEICDHFCESIVSTAETENKILPIKKNIKTMASESSTKLLMEPEGTMAKLKKLRIVESTEEKKEQAAKTTRKFVVRESSTASADD